MLNFDLVVRKLICLKLHKFTQFGQLRKLHNCSVCFMNFNNYYGGIRSCNKDNNDTIVN